MPQHGVTDETIAAIATPPGSGGVGIVRLSGPKALPLFRQVFQPRNARDYFVSHHLYLGTILARDGSVLDEALGAFMRAPHTYTGEDLAEFQCHASPVVLQELLEHLFTLGARLAEPGEFTKRAFLAGRVDLSQAEAVLDLLGARTKTAANIAAAQLQGSLTRRVEAVREALLELLAQLEVAIDFPEDDADIFDRHEAADFLRLRVQEPIEALLANANTGRLYREGARAVLAGLPNAGKSSLLNALLNEERALVTPIPGTTRDTIEEPLDLDGIPLCLVDTAGIRNGADDPVEALGVERARQALAGADLTLFLLDAESGFNKEARQLLASINCDRLIFLINKCDIINAGQEEALRKKLSAEIPEHEIISISARTGAGLPNLRAALLRLLAPKRGAVSENTVPLAPNRRHRALLTQALEACTSCQEALANGMPPDLVSVDLQTVMDHIATITGHLSPDEVLDAVFSRFCIGK